MTFEGTQWRDGERHFKCRTVHNYRKFISKPFTVFHLSRRCHIIFERACSGIAGEVPLSAVCRNESSASFITIGEKFSLVAISAGHRIERFCLEINATLGQHPVECKERNRLLHEYNSAVREVSRAVGELADLAGTSSADDYALLGRRRYSRPSLRVLRCLCGWLSDPRGLRRNGLPSPGTEHPRLSKANVTLIGETRKALAH